MPATPEEIDAERAKANQSLPPRRVWEEQRIRALAQAIVRRMGHEAPMVASSFDLAHVHDWAAEIVELCERNGGRQAKYEAAAALDGENAP